MARKKWLVVLMLMVFVLTLAVGCGQQAGEENNGDKRSRVKIKIVNEY